VKSRAATFIDRSGMNLGAQSPARAAQSLIGAVFFGAPAACRCARTVVASIKREQAWAKRSDWSNCHSRRQTPRSSQRRNRM
jgi:hypothetical protein